MKLSKSGAIEVLSTKLSCPILQEPRSSGLVLI